MLPIGATISLLPRSRRIILDVKFTKSILLCTTVFFPLIFRACHKPKHFNVVNNPRLKFNQRIGKKKDLISYWKCIHSLQLMTRENKCCMQILYSTHIKLMWLLNKYSLLDESTFKDFYVLSQLRALNADIIDLNNWLVKIYFCYELFQ